MLLHYRASSPAGGAAVLERVGAPPIKSQSVNMSDQAEQATERPRQITDLLARWGAGDDEARSLLFEQVYPQLKKLAEGQLRRSPGELTLGTTDLAHEAYLRLVELHGLDWQDRRHFFAMMARMTRQLVIDLLRRKGAAKRGGQVPFVDLQDWDGREVPLDGSVDWLGVDEALRELERLDERSARIVELKFFSGLTGAEIAAALGCSVPTVKRRWRFARSWLANRLRDAAP